MGFPSTRSGDQEPQWLGSSTCPVCMSGSVVGSVCRGDAIQARQESLGRGSAHPFPSWLLDPCQLFTHTQGTLAQRDLGVWSPWRLGVGSPGTRPVTVGEGTALDWSWLVSGGPASAFDHTGVTYIFLVITTHHFQTSPCGPWLEARLQRREAMSFLLGLLRRPPMSLS